MKCYHRQSCGPLAQRSEQGTHNPLVVGSNPTGPTILFRYHCFQQFTPFYETNWSWVRFVISSEEA